MTKKELQAELIRQIKDCDAEIESYSEGSAEWEYCEGLKRAFIHVLQLVEHLDEGKE